MKVTFDADPDDFMRLSRGNESRKTRVNSMGKTIQLSRAIRGPRAATRCPQCDGPYDVVTLGTGWTACPHCDTRLHFDSGGKVTVGEVIAASSGFDLTPMERRIARQVGVTFQEAEAAKKLYG